MIIQRVLLLSNRIDLQLFVKFLRNLTKTVENFKFLMIICRWMILFVLRERKSVSNNLIGANQPSMECCINQSTVNLAPNWQSSILGAALGALGARFTIFISSPTKINQCFSLSIYFSTVVYSDKPKAEPGSYYTPGMSQTVKYLIQSLECHTNLVVRNILYDRLYTSIPTAQWLLDSGKSSVGTLQSNRKAIPAEIREIKDRGLLGKGITAY